MEKETKRKINDVIQNMNIMRIIINAQAVYNMNIALSDCNRGNAEEFSL